LHDVHFWLGATTTQDEAGTAAYKTVELDTLLGGVPVQHREVEEHESDLFLSYFAAKGGIRVLEGGIESGFNHVKPTEYKPHLLHLKGKKYVRVVEVPLSHKSLNSGDVFVLDNGLKIYTWTGKSAAIAEKTRAAQLTVALDDERGGKPERLTLAEGETGADAKAFWEALGGEGKVAGAEEAGGDAEWEKVADKKLFRFSDASGKEEFKKVSEGKLAKSSLDSKDAFILDIGKEVYVWIGKDASTTEKAKALKYAQDYLKAEKRPNFIPIARIVQGGENDGFWKHFDS